MTVGRIREGISHTVAPHAFTADVVTKLANFEVIDLVDSLTVVRKLNK